MKKTSIILVASLIICGGFLFTSCNKDEAEATATPEVPAAEVLQSQDVFDTREASDDAGDEASNAFAGSSMARITGQGFRERCNITVDSTVSAKTIKLTFTGADCSGLKTRSGSITVRLIAGDKWKDVGAKLQITFENFKVVRNADKKSVTINGVKYITNLSGGIYPIVDKKPNIIHSIKASLTIQFDDATERNWVITRKRTITLEDNKPVVKVESDSSGTSISEYGINRDGEDFIVTIPEAITIKACGTITTRPRPIKGVIVNTTGTKITSTLFGYKSLTEKATTCETTTGMVMRFDDGTKKAAKFVPFK